MEHLYNTYKERDVEVVLLYTREPHPGKTRYHQPTTYEERMAYAQELQTAYQVSHPIWVDEMSDTVRKLYGGRPNMVYIVDKRGLIIYKSSWTQPDDIETVLANLGEREEARAQQVRVCPVYSERTTYLPIKDSLNIERVGMPIYEDEPDGPEQKWGEDYAQVARKRARSS